MLRRWNLALCGLLFAASSTLSAAEPTDWIKANLPQLVTLYREFHQAPELSFQEKATAAKLANELKAAGLEVTTGVGGHGVVGILKNGAGPTVMFRTDLDALPVAEQTNLVYASTVKVPTEDGGQTGVMHACGHDIHITNLIGLSRYLAAHRDQWQGTLMVIGQPAEERGAGARAMLEAGLFTKFPKPDYAVALHCDADLATGKLAYLAGPAFANVDSVDITIKGRGGHGSAPHTTIDPVVIAAHLVVDLQSIVSREIAPLESAVVTVGSIHGGSKHNIIGDSCHLQLTVRSYKDDVRKHLLAAIERKAKAAAASAGAPEPVIKISEGTPSLHNNPDLVARVLPALKSAIGADNVTPDTPTMGGEDFSQYGLAGVPVFMFKLGSVDAHRLAGFERIKLPPPSLHSPLYYPDAEATLQTGLEASIAAVQALLPAAKR